MKVIGITCAHSTVNNVNHYSVSREYVDSIIKANAIPLLIPCETSNLEEMLKQVDGVILIGGVDINPLMYNETYHFNIEDSNYERDLFDYQVVKMCASNKIPLLGICRGLQMINVAFNGTLYQDLKEYEYAHNHRQKELRQYPVHKITIEEDSFLYPIFNKEALVNSFHHQAIKDLGEDLKVVAKAQDGIVEAIQHSTLPIYGVQFHPEMMHLHDQNMQKIFNQFIESVGK